MDFPSALSTWQAALTQAGKSPRTVADYATSVKALNRTLLLLDPPHAVAPRLQAWRATQQLNLSLGTSSVPRIRGYIAALRSFYSVLVSHKLYPDNPARALVAPAAVRGMPRPVKDAEVDRLFAGLPSETPEQLQALAMVWLYYSSIRNSEVNALSTSNVSYDAADQTLMLQFVGKRAKERIVALHPSAAEVLARHILNRFGGEARVEAALGVLAPDDAEPLQHARLLAVDQLLTCELKTQSSPLFLHQGKPLTRREANRQFRAVRIQLGLGEKVRPHALRHTFATDLLNRGEDIRVVQEILGHASIRQTAEYAEVLTSKKASAARRLRVPRQENV